MRSVWTSFCLYTYYLRKKERKKEQKKESKKEQKKERTEVDFCAVFFVAILKERKK